MCILFIAVEQSQKFPLVIAANRDEFHARPTAKSGFWDNHPHLVAGRDLQAYGTWMGVTRNEKVAALTNIRAPETIKTDAISRGELVADWLIDEALEQNTYLEQLQQNRHQYNGYNLVYGDIRSLAVYNNFEDSHAKLNSGVYGLSNANLTTPWPKVTKGIDSLTGYVSHNDTLDTEALFAILKDEAKAPDKSLPNTGIGYEWEKRLSSIFIQSPEYGTRTSTLLLVDSNQQIHWYERTFNAKGNVTGNVNYTLA
ncbi:NRDE family protein [Alteromonas sp. 1_MG-2023]|uniref:NRDE family protein n=1 Tax=Alteromonas sp. 1_MG-2023 TaxID=3062669 RepID=UPI0026E34D1D|nr:NRDE family protein [Alteromonas sp. 1_MG-2023]MDO6568035.1 NRDE family protein [Alteromonas sp. 1_MG-2023]